MSHRYASWSRIVVDLSLPDLFFVGTSDTRVVLLCLILVLGACDSNSDSPPTGALAATVATNGEMTDSDGYTLSVGNQSADVEPDGSATISDLTEGPYEVSLEGLSANCSVDGANPRSAIILQRDTTAVSFSVTCRSTSGAVEVSAQTIGETPDTDGYLVIVDGTDSMRIEKNGRATFRNLAPDSHNVALSDVQVNCSVTGDNPQSVSITGDEIATLSFGLTCPYALFDAIAFQSDRASDHNIHSIDRDGTDVVQITSHSANERRPTVSPDGSHIAFYTDRDGNTEIYTIKPDGSTLTRVTNNAGSDRSPAWAPDGSRIAFETDRDGNNEIYTIGLDGSDLTRVTNNSAFDGRPTWSPNGSRLAFYTDRDGNDEIYTVKPDGSDLTRVTTNSASDFTPDWSPNGKRIVFHTLRDGNSEIYTVNPDGSDLKRYTFNSAFDGTAGWSPSR